MNPKETPYTRRIDSRILDFIAHSRLPVTLAESRHSPPIIGRRERLLVALSGGPDSTALLLVLVRLRKRLGIKLEAAHFNHRLRSREEAAGDAAYCQSLCRALRVPLALGAGDVPARVRRRRETIEEAARNLRYAFLGRQARKLKATAVAVGHTMDDRAETVLLNIVRGAGMDGIAAMPARSPWPFGDGPEIARPLLELTREETERYCKESGLESRHDPTNNLLIATRNRIRHELLPLLRSFNPRIARSLARLSDAACRDKAFIEQFLESGNRLYTSRDRGGISFDRTSLERLDAATTSRDLRAAAAEVSRGKADLEWEHVEKIYRSLAKQRSRTSLPGGLVAVTDPYSVTIWPGQPPAPPPVPHMSLRSTGTTRAGDWVFEIAVEDAGTARKPEGPTEAVIDAGHGRRWELKVRSRQPGDRLRPLGLRGTKKVQDILVDAKVPREERDGVPIIVDNEGIVWVVGHCLADRVKITRQTKQVLRLRARRR